MNGDVDLEQGLITVRQSKNLPMRLVPITDCAVVQLRRYQKARDQRFGHSDDSHAFIRSPRGGHLGYGTMMWAFKQLRERIGLKSASGRNPCLHDLRHTFACNHLLRAYRENRNIDNAVHELSIYLGHATLASTYWYLSGVPALLEQCIKRGEAQASVSKWRPIMKNSEPNIARHLKQFLAEYLTQQRGCSLHTVWSYRDALCCLLRHLQETHGVAPNSIKVTDLSADNIMAFLNYLQKSRKQQRRDAESPAVGDPNVRQIPTVERANVDE